MRKLIFLSFMLMVLFCHTAPVQVSALFVDLTHPQVLAIDHADSRLIPASITKLFISAAALRYWQSNHVFTTAIYQRGNVKNGVLQGDLIFYGMGDPMLTNDALWQLVNNLQLTGLKKVNGSIIVNNSYLGFVPANDPDRLEAHTKSQDSYDALLSSTGTNFATITLRVMPGNKVGARAKVDILPLPLENVRLDNQLITQNSLQNAEKLPQVSRETKNNQEIFHLNGAIPLNAEPMLFYRSVGNPDYTTGALFKALLFQARIAITGNIKIESLPLQKSDILVTDLNSPQLIAILQQMLEYSNNYIADLLTLDLWREQQKVSSAKMPLNIATKPLLVLYQTLKKFSPFAKNNSADPILDSASGLTPTNRLSARDLIILLNGMYHDQTHFPVFYGNLVIPGMQTIWRHFNTAQHPWMQRVSIKTGSLKLSMGVFNITGYFRRQNGDLGAFALILNQSGLAPDKVEDTLGRVLISKLDQFFAKN